MLSERADAAALALILPAMAAAADLIIEGEVSARLLYHLQGPLQELTRLRLPGVARIAVEATHATSTRPPAAGVGLGFSAGVDSWHALWRHTRPDTPAGMAINHLTFHDVGAHDRVETLFEERCARSARIAKFAGLPLTVVRSNLDDFYASHPAIGFAYSDAIRNVAAAHVLAGGLGRFYYASSTAYPVTATDKPLSGRSDLVAIPMFASDRLDPLPVDGDVPRTAKMERLSEVPATFDTLDVCVNASWVGRDTINCGVCTKCLRAIATLEILGRLMPYASLFDLDAYARRRTTYWARVLRSTSTGEREVVRLARERRFRIPTAAFAWSALRWPETQHFARRAAAWWARRRSVV